MSSDKLVLRKEMKANGYECLATVRKESDRPDIEVAMKLLKRFGRLSPEILSDHLLPGRPLAMANNLYRSYQELEFIDQSGYPLEFGEAAKEGSIYLPERGKYLIFSSDEPLITQGVVALTYPDKKRPQSNQGKNATKTPESIGKAIGKKIPVWTDSLENVYIENVEGLSIPLKESLQISLEATLHSTSTTIRLKKNDSQKILQLNGENLLGLKKVWEIITKANNIETWKGGPLNEGVLEVRFSELSPQEISSFERTLKSPIVNLPKLGQYTVTPFIVRIQPLTKTDALHWATYLLISQINDYQTNESFQKIVEQVKSKFPSYDLMMPGIERTMELVMHEKTLSETERLRKYWYLRAPIDLVEVS